MRHHSDDVDQVPLADDVTPRQDNRTLDGIFQLPDIARPVVVQQHVHGAGGEFAGLLVQFGREFAEEM